MCVVLECGCASADKGQKNGVAYQDVVYGKGNRVHNPLPKVGDDRKYRCTVCLKERGKSGKAAGKAIDEKKEKKSAKKDEKRLAGSKN